ncbi:MAG: hypothetical protein IJ493_13295 [Clostridia bacterium]|nr:hypothetical protein [Clostridia bacterium]
MTVKRVLVFLIILVLIAGIVNYKQIADVVGEWVIEFLYDVMDAKPSIIMDENVTFITEAVK